MSFKPCQYFPSPYCCSQCGQPTLFPSGYEPTIRKARRARCRLSFLSERVCVCSPTVSPVRLAGWLILQCRRQSGKPGKSSPRPATLPQPVRECVDMWRETRRTEISPTGRDKKPSDFSVTLSIQTSENASALSVGSTSSTGVTRHLLAKVTVSRLSWRKIE